MANRIILKKSSVTTKVPQTSDLEYGELALNYADEKLYFKNSNNVIKSFSTTGVSLETLTIGSGLTGTSYNGANPVTIEHADTSSVSNVSSDNSGNTFIQDISLTFDTFGHVTGATVGTGTVTVGDGTLTLATSGIATGSQTFTANQGTNATFTVNVPGTDLSYTTAASTGTVASSTGTNATLPAATTSLAGLMTGADKTKLDGIATGATANTGTVTSVSGTGTVSGLSLSGTVTTSGNLTLGGTLSVTPSNFSSQTANTFLAAPNGSAGVPTFRTIVAADVPTLNQNTTGSAATLTTGRTIGMTGDVTWTSASFNGSANVTGTSTLANSGVTAGSYGSSTQIPVLTIDAKGRVTAASTSSITVGDGTLTLATSGIATGSQTFTANQGTNATFTVNVPGTNIAEGTRTTTTVPITSSTGSNASLSAATTSLAGVMSSADKTKLDGIAAGAQVNVATNLGYTTASSNGTVTSSTGTNATIPAATTSLAGLMTSADKSKLDGIESGAQVNVATNLGITAGTTAGPIVTSSTGTNATLPTASATASGVVTTGNQTWAGVKTFNSTITGSISGNAGTATTLQTSRNINGIGFNGSADISVPDLRGSNGTTTLASTGVASAVNHLTTSNAATGNTVGLSTAGSDANIGLTITTKGTGSITLDTGTGAGHIDLKPGTDAFRLWDDDSSHYYTFSTGNIAANYTISLPAGNVTLTAGTSVVTTRSISTNNGLTGGGDLSANRTFGLTGQALALHNLATNGIIARTGAGTVAGRTITASTGISVTNGDGVSGNPTIAVNAASASVRGGVLLGSDTQQTVAANAVSATAARSYAVQVNASGQMLVNVPWENTGTTYSAGNGISLSGTTFSVAGGTGLTQEASGLALTAITAGNATVGALRYNSTTRVAGQMYGGTTNPISTTRLNYDGYLHTSRVIATQGVQADSTGPFIMNATTVSANFTIPTNFNAMSAGPITINNGIVVTVPNGSVWTIV